MRPSSVQAVGHEDVDRVGRLALVERSWCWMVFVTMPVTIVVALAGSLLVDGRPLGPEQVAAAGLLGLIVAVVRGGVDRRRDRGGAVHVAARLGARAARAPRGVHVVAHAVLAGALGRSASSCRTRPGARRCGLRSRPSARSSGSQRALQPRSPCGVPGTRSTSGPRGTPTSQSALPPTSDRARAARSGWSANTPSTPVRSTEVNQRSQSPCAATSPPRRSGAGRNRFSGRRVQV